MQKQGGPGHRTGQDNLGPAASTYLAEEAQAAYMALTDAQARDYDTVKAAILDRLRLSLEKYWQRFRAAL